MFLSPGEKKAENQSAHGTAYRTALDEYLFRALAPMSFVLSALYLAFAVAHIFLLDPRIATTMAVVAFASSAALLLLGVYLRRRRLSVELAHPAGFIIFLIVLANCFGHLYLEKNPAQTTNFMLLVVAVGAFALSNRWFVLMFVVTIAAWFVGVYFSAGLARISHWLFGLVSASVLAWLIHEARVRTLIHNNELFIQNERRKTDLEHALQLAENARKEAEITSQHLRETLDSLRESENRYRLLVELTPQFIAILRGGKILFVNDFGARLLGASRPEELVGKPMTRFIHPNYAEIARQRLKEMELDQITAPPIQEKFIALDGREIDVDVSAIPFKYQGETAIQLIARDNSGHASVQKELLNAADAALKASRMKSEFLSNMSHEIRTPMNGILGMTNLLAETELNQEQQEYLEIIKQCSESLLSLIDEILDFSNIEAGRVELAAKEFDLHAHLGGVMKTLYPSAYSKQIELSYAIDPRVPAVLRGDPDRLRQILLNLTGNAIKFTQEGEVFINVEILDDGTPTGLDGSEIWLQFMVLDTGIGIPEEKIDTIFAEFTQVDGSSTRKYGGTGLGLSITQKLVELLDGEIWVESEVGKGSRFFFTARFGRPKADALSRKPQEIPAHSRAIIVREGAVGNAVLDGILREWHLLPEFIPGLPGAIKALGGDATRLKGVNGVILDLDWNFARATQELREIVHLAHTRKLRLLICIPPSLRHDVVEELPVTKEELLVKPFDFHQLCGLLALPQQEEGDRQAVALDEETTRAMEPPLAETLSPGDGRRILLADDDRISLKLTSTLLARKGFSVQTVASGQEVLELMQKHHFDLILMDVRMPKMDGFEATAAIRAKEQETGAHIPIIALTAHALEEDEQRCIEAGMDDYLAKPVNAEDLYQKILALLPQNSRSSRSKGND